MSRKPNDMTARKPSTEKAGKKKPKPDTGGEETPITISGGSIIVESALEREETGVKKHKKCKINDTDGKKWTLDHVEIWERKGTVPLQSIPIANPDYLVKVCFKRP